MFKFFGGYAAYLLLLIITGYPPSVFAGPMVVLTDAQEKYPLGQVMEYLEDPEGTLTIEDVVSPATAAQFVPSRWVIPNFGFTKSAYWVRIRIKNPEVQNTLWVLETGLSTMQHIACYRPRAGTSAFEVIRTGMLHSFSTREIDYHRFTFLLSLPPGTDQTFYLRFQSQSAIMLPLTLWSQDAFSSHSRKRLLVSGLFYGALLLLIVYNTFLWVALRDHTYGYYVCLMTCTIIALFAFEGLGGQYLWPDRPGLTGVVILVCRTAIAIFTPLFVMTFLNTRVRAPFWHRMMLGMIAVWSLIIILIPFFSYGLVVRLILFLSIFSNLLLTVVNWLVWRQGYRPARILF